jgi:hypothetical protein
MSHASKEFKIKIIAKPTLVAIEELQLQDLQNMDAAVEVKQNARPPRHDAAIVPSGPARGIENKRPMTSTYTM